MAVGDVERGTDLLVIGGGPGGYAAAIRGAQRGLDVTLVERDSYGGTCLNRGCIPSKALVSVAGLADDAGSAESIGVHADPVVDMGQTAAWIGDVVDRLSGAVEKLCKANGVTLVEGVAEFAGPNEARVRHEGEGRGAETLRFERAVVATGSRPVELPALPFDDDRVLDSAAALALDRVPDRLVVVGAGYIGMELSTAFAKLGADVTVVEALDEALTGYEDDVTRAVRDGAAAAGVEVRLGERAVGLAEADGAVLETETDEGTERYPADAVLVAVGRDPVTNTVNLDAVGLTPEPDGSLAVDETCRTDAEGVFAVGDVAGDPMLAHRAYREGAVAAAVAAGDPEAVDDRAVPAAVFTDPEVATVGLTADEARDAGYEPAVGEMPFRASGRALTTGHSDGFARVVADAETGVVLGGQVVGREASELIAEVTLAVEMGATLVDLAATVHVHPTLTEAVHEAVENARDEAIHTLNR
ncbi:MAG: dihydrolipoamide dehydrogenase [uncultured archaeon A07HB70]|nr:MAG: dihydrolipoamide dehydrogenase [uncultured archaeon A07HB70]